jgi:hypothetical protein
LLPGCRLTVNTTEAVATPLNMTRAFTAQAQVPRIAGEVSSAPA